MWARRRRHPKQPGDGAHSQASPRASSHAVATVAARCATSIGTLGITMGAAIESAIDVAWLEPVLAAAADVHAAAM